MAISVNYMRINDLIKIITPYCDRIIRGGKHLKAYPKGSRGVIVISYTASDTNFYKQVFRDFRRHGILINELNK